MGLAVLLLFLGVAALVYPKFSAWYSEEKRGSVTSQYYEEVENKENTELLAVLDAAQEWNDRLYRGEIQLLDVESCGYYDQLDILGNGIMGYIDIPAIDVYLPVYHGTGSNEMSVGAGHMAQSSLPVGGNNSHSVISAHTGSANAPFFSNLTQVEIGDVFYIHILDVTIAYKVSGIRTVSPDDVKSVQIEAGKDLCTLVTCTPFPLLTERLLVTGERVECAETVVEETVAAEVDTGKNGVSFLDDYYIFGICLGLGLFLVAISGFGFVMLWRKRRQKHVPGAQNGAGQKVEERSDK